MPTNDAFDMAWAASKDEEIHKGIMDSLRRIRDSHKMGKLRRDQKRMEAMQRGLDLTHTINDNRRQMEEAEAMGVDFDEVDNSRRLEEEVVQAVRNRGNTDDDVFNMSADALPLEDPFANPFSNPNAFAIKEPRKDVPAEYITPIVKAEPPQEKPDIGIDVVEGDDLSLLPASLFPRNTPGGDNMSLLPSGWNSD
tara:strand:- start:1811 stop:2395 length:585 start_codon:yes stop_codon:yes gene_type:complete